LIPFVALEVASLSKHPSYLLCHEANFLPQDHMANIKVRRTGQLSYRLFGRVQRLVDAAIREDAFNVIER